MAPRPTDTDDRIRQAGLEPDHVRQLAHATLAEDLQWGPDVTTEATIAVDAATTATVVARETGVLAGIPIAAAVIEAAQSRPDEVRVEVLLGDGDRVRPGDAILRLTGPTRTLLTAERSLLNLLCHLSGVASATDRWVQAVEGTRARIRDTRKTLPGLRILQKYAVRCGGGVNHRMGLGDAALIKDNHVAAAGSLGAAFAAVRAAAPDVPVEVECDTLAQVAEALAIGAEEILLDNMSPDAMREAVRLAADRPGVRLEASGGLTLPDAAAVAATGVDFISVGALTHSTTVLDLGLDM
ncbi:carboxylating nicotinate-nucleotide diphosphorylase [Propionibacteriaceae bacterium Y2011]|uniref:carboxylating nicotinate-nucleotide diphosphorylase n=1 Tax=Microlunatus sp. Y2014 TaxID=3418488 RepID=UPI003B4451BA